MNEVDPYNQFDPVTGKQTDEARQRMLAEQGKMTDQVFCPITPMPNSVTTFHSVMLALKSERAYQDTKWTELDKDNTLQHFKQYMQNYLDRITNFTDTAMVLENIRKVTAIGVRAMEKFGAPQRSGFEVKE